MASILSRPQCVKGQVCVKVVVYVIQLCGIVQLQATQGWRVGAEEGGLLPRGGTLPGRMVPGKVSTGFQHRGLPWELCAASQVSGVSYAISKQKSLPPFIFLEVIRHIRHFLIDKVFKKHFVFYDKSDRNWCFSFGNLGIIFNSASAQHCPPGRMGNSAGSKVIHQLMLAEINRCRMVSYDDVMTWKHCLHFWSLCFVGNPPVTGRFVLLRTIKSELGYLLCC